VVLPLPLLPLLALLPIERRGRRQGR
jgi:hypothetical protein